MATNYAETALQRDTDIDHRALMYGVLNEEAAIIRTFDHATLRESVWAIDGALLDPAFNGYRSSGRFQALRKKLVAAY